MKDNKMNDKEPYVPITEDMADNDLLEEYEAKLAAQKQARASAPQPVSPQETEPVAPAAPPVPPAPQESESKQPIYKKWWFWLIIAVVIIAIVVAIVIGAKKGDTKEQTSTSVSSSTSAQSTTESTSATTQTTEQSTSASTTTASTTKAATTEDEDSKESRFNYALEKAKALNSLMHLSKQSIYNELVSKSGEGLKADAAQYAIDHLKANYKANALIIAKEYVSEGYGEDEILLKLLDEDLFTDEEAQYAVDHLD